MPKKSELLRKIDQKATIQGGGGVPLKQEVSIAPPAIASLPAPDTLIYVSQGIQRSTQAPLVYVSISWQSAPNVSPDYYLVEWSTDSGFTDVQRKQANQTSATIENLAVGTTYYFRVQAVQGGRRSDFTDALSVLTDLDLTVPDEVLSAGAVFRNSDLYIEWEKPDDEAFKDVEISIYNAARSVLYGLYYSASQQFIWTADVNLQLTSQVGATDVSITIKSRSWNNVFSTGTTITATASALSTPTLKFSNWTSDNGTASENLTISWFGIDNADNYDLILDGTTYNVKNTQYTYPYALNLRDHNPTLVSGDYNITYTVKARSKIGQVSALLSGQLTNTAPSGSMYSVATVVGFSEIAATISALSTYVVQDFDHYNWQLTNLSGQLIQQFNSTTPDVIFPLVSGGIYTINTRVFDKFNRSSNPITVSGLIADTLTISQLRAETYYIDSLGATSPTLDFFKDGILGSGSNKIYSAVASGTYNYIEAQRPLLDRYKTVTFDATYVGATLSYLTYNNGTTNTYYAGPITTGSSGQKTLTKYTVEATAKSNAFRLDLLGITRIDLPNIQEARNVRINFSNYAGNLTVYEYYPRRLVQSDDIEAESVKAINVAAAAITADKISVINLQAVSANMGALTMDGVISIGVSGGIYQGTGSFASPTTGLKLFNSGGVGKLSTYNAGVEQVTLDTDGVLKAGAGNVNLDANGLRIIAKTGTGAFNEDPIRAVSWIDASNRVISYLQPTLDTSGNNVWLRLAAKDASNVYSTRITIETWRNSNVNGYIVIDGTAARSQIQLNADDNFAGNNSASTFSISGYVGLPNVVSGISLTADGTIRMRQSGTTRYRLDFAVGSAVAQAAAFDDTGSVYIPFQVIGLSHTLYNATALTNSTTTLNLVHVTSGTAAAGLGYDIHTWGDTTTSNRQLATIRSTWIVATDASRTARLRFFVYDATTARQAITLESSGTQALIGLYGATAVAQAAAITAPTGGTTIDTQARTAISSIITAIKNIGITA
jgi:hypothetical protein